MHGKFATIPTVSIAVAGCLIGLSLHAQDAAPTTVTPGQTQKIGPAPAPGSTTAAPTKKMLDDALAPQTRQTLQQAMDSIDPATLAVPVTKLSIGPGEAAELDGKKINPIAFSALPAPVKDALSGGARNTLSGAGK